jgi:hypothetical protein
MRGSKRRLTPSAARRARAAWQRVDAERLVTIATTASTGQSVQMARQVGHNDLPVRNHHVGIAERRDRRAVCMTMRSAATLMSRLDVSVPMADVSRSNLTNRSNCLSEFSDLVGSKSGRHGLIWPVVV